MNNNEERSSIIQTVNNPLGFFALALLIVEGFLGIILVFAKNPNPEKMDFWGMIIGAILFLLVVIAVTILTWFKPDSLGLSGKDYKDLKQHELGLQITQPSLPVEQVSYAMSIDSIEQSEFQNLQTFLVWNSQTALKWFSDHSTPVNENFFLATYSLPYPPPEPTSVNVLSEKHAVLAALKNSGLLETTDDKLKISAKGTRFLKFIGFTN